MTNTKVDKVIIEDGRAVAVRTVPSKPIGDSKVSRTFKARKQIVVSCGTVSSPMVLQRSGIGEPSKLRAAGVKPIVELPGVGRNFQDHFCYFVPYRIKQDSESFDAFVSGDKEAQKSAFDQWYATGAGPLATNGIEAGVKIRPTEAELATADKAFQQGWESYFENKPDKPLMHYSVISGFFGDHTRLPPGKYMTVPFLRISILKRLVTHFI
ncbi:unnamed protein product [[Candida] boidinii]|nr:unnamed protein product [[Candida] boidinii]